jgi:hypothetical protein
MAQFAMCSRASMYQTSLTLAEPADITTPTADTCDAMAARLGDDHMKKPVSGSPFVCFEFHWSWLPSPPAAPQCKRFHHTHSHKPFGCHFSVPLVSSPLIENRSRGGPDPARVSTHRSITQLPKIPLLRHPRSGSAGQSYRPSLHSCSLTRTLPPPPQPFGLCHRIQTIPLATTPEKALGGTTANERRTSQTPALHRKIWQDHQTSDTFPPIYEIVTSPQPPQ